MQCGNVITSRKADLVTHTLETMTFHLELFYKFNAINKITLYLSIQEEISLNKSWKLHDIIYHEGRHANSRHYTCSIRSSAK